MNLTGLTQPIPEAGRGAFDANGGSQSDGSRADSFPEDMCASERSPIDAVGRIAPREYKPGLDGVVAAQTRLSSVDGEAGELIIAGFPVGQLAQHATFEEVTYLLWNGELPDQRAAETFAEELAARRVLPSATVQLLRDSAALNASPMDALRMAAGTLSLGVGGNSSREEALTLVAAMPTIVAAYHRLLQGLQPIAPNMGLKSHAANFLFMLDGTPPDAARVRALEGYLNTVVDHGLNASTFAARVIVATGSDFVSAIVGAIGALKGPLHGGAPGPALDMVFEIADANRADEYLRRKLECGDRLMGFGHRIYKVRDPRADVLAAIAEKLYSVNGQREFYALAKHVEETACACLKSTSPEDDCKRTSSSTRHFYCTVWACRRRCSRPSSRWRARQDGLRIALNSSGRENSSVRNRSISVHANVSGRLKK